MTTEHQPLRRNNGLPPCPSTLTRDRWTCFCRQHKDHDGDHACKCGARWPRA